MEVAIFTRKGVTRIMRFAFELARKRRLTLVTKSNAQRHGMVLWDAIFQETAAGYPEVITDRMLVDAATTRMVLRSSTPRRWMSWWRRTFTPTSSPIWRPLSREASGWALRPT